MQCDHRGEIRVLWTKEARGGKERILPFRLQRYRGSVHALARTSGLQTPNKFQWFKVTKLVASVREVTKKLLHYIQILILCSGSLDALYEYNITIHSDKI